MNHHAQQFTSVFGRIRNNHFVMKTLNSLLLREGPISHHLRKLENKIKKLRLGYVPGVIRHYFHGSKKNRKYRERWEILVKNNFDPLTYIRRDANGVLEPTEICPQEMLDEIMEYFKERNEDE